MWYVIVESLALPVSQGFDLQTSAVRYMMSLIEVLSSSFPNENFDDIFNVAMF